MIAAIILMKLTARRRTTHAQVVNLLATTANASIIIWFATKFQIVLTIPMNRRIAMLMNALRLKSTNVAINALTL